MCLHRSLDITKITTMVKSWIYADMLEKPEELVLYRSRKLGGLNLINIKFRAMAEQIKSFLDTAVNPKFRNGLYHRALYDWHVDNIRTIPNPGRPAYYSEDFFSTIRTIKSQGLLRISTLSIGLWYKALMETYVTAETDENGFTFDKRCKIELEYPNNDWEKTWSLASIPGLTSDSYTFLFKMIHNILPTQQRLHRILTSVTSPTCTLCDSQSICCCSHALFTCNYNIEVGNWLINVVNNVTPGVTPRNLILLNLNIDSRLNLPITWIISQTLKHIWNCRHEKKACTLFQTRARLEANIMLLRKNRLSEVADIIEDLLDYICMLS